MRSIIIYEIKKSLNYKGKKRKRKKIEKCMNNIYNMLSFILINIYYYMYLYIYNMCVLFIICKIYYKDQKEY